ncbi:isoprenylcysteine carboxylmethyltransferase family protein [Ruegeria sp. EL01]|jgi:protein-S-isoprenylcysteine O-methyltransferase Ste14|uniref:methyltransferase family protein n=1 Tax=Ruegeria sp. EL01 TaxID=2107578 RepID=UPI0013C5395B|nr:isoprenylcysteine carboxylmethyltransferase family protein [Ruegeria sp. EL01]
MTKTVLILPGTALIYIPILIQWFSERWPFGASVGTRLQLAVAVMLAVPALVLAAYTMKLFVRDGHGTPAPWDPPQRFVVSGPYRFVRNPMLSSVILMILAEAVALNSPLLLGWALVFFLLNTLYFIFIEEPGLERRFGEDYRKYKAAVPRWVAMLRPYEPAGDNGS